MLHDFNRMFPYSYDNKIQLITFFFFIVETDKLEGINATKKRGKKISKMLILRQIYSMSKKKLYVTWKHYHCLRATGLRMKQWQKRSGSDEFYSF